MDDVLDAERDKKVLAKRAVLSIREYVRMPASSVRTNSRGPRDYSENRSFDGVSAKPQNDEFRNGPQRASRSGQDAFRHAVSF